MNNWTNCKSLSIDVAQLQFALHLHLILKHSKMTTVEELTQQLAAMKLARDSVQEQYDQSTEMCKELSAKMEQMQATELMVAFGYF